MSDAEECQHAKEESRGPASFATRWDGTTELRCVGILDMASQAELRGILAEVVARKPEHVVIDLREVPWFDCGTIGAFVDARSTLQASGGDLSLRAPTALGRRVLRVVGLAHLAGDDSLDDASELPALAPASADLDRLVESWTSACETASFRKSTVVFADPVAVMSTIVGLLDERGPTLSPPVVADLLLAAVRTDGPSRTIAVMQLLALSRVVHAWIESNVKGEQQQARQQRLRDDLDHAVGAVVSAALDDFEQAALLDPLTGLLNRRALDHDLGPILAAARRHGECLTVVMIDVEGLKAINDLVGHAAGDDTLRDVAATLAATLRAGDKAYRIGGDEFVLVFPGLLPADVEGVMNRTVVERGAFTWGCAWLGGQDSWVRGENDPVADTTRARDLLKLADQRMLEYRARTPDEPSESWSGSTAIAQSRSSGIDGLAEQINAAGRAEVVVEQATGVIAQHFGLRVEDASIALRAFARRRRQPIETVASALVDRTLDIGEMASHRPGSERAEPAGRGVVRPAPDGYPET